MLSLAKVRLGNIIFVTWVLGINYLSHHCCFLGSALAGSWSEKPDLSIETIYCNIGYEDLKWHLTIILSAHIHAHILKLHLMSQWIWYLLMDSLILNYQVFTVRSTC